MRELSLVLLMTSLLVGGSAASDTLRTSDETRSYDLITTQVKRNKILLRAEPVAGSAVRETLDKGDVVVVLSFSGPHYWYVAREGLVGYVFYVNLEETDRMLEIRRGHSGTGYEHLTLEQLGIDERPPPGLGLSYGTHGGGGYSVNILNQWAGVCAFSTRAKGFGFYADVKFTVPLVASFDNFYHDVSVSEAEGWGDTLKSERSNWVSLSIGVTRVLSRQSAVYAAIGYSNRTDYCEFYGSPHTSRDDGNYWVVSDGTGYLNALGGFIVFSDRNVGVLVGGQLKPAGVTAALVFVE